MKRTQLIPFLLLFLVGTAVSPVSGEEAVDPWADLRRLEGIWQGAGTGFGETAPVTHDWSFVFGEIFLRLETVSGDEGAERGDVGYISFDKAKGAHVFRQFFSEGFVNTYDVQTTADEPGKIVFEYREAENAGSMKARLILTFTGDKTCTMVLEPAGEDNEFAACQNMEMKRQ